MRVPTLEDQWQKFKQLCKIDRDGVPEIQKQEMEYAFKSGCASILVAQLEFIGSSNISEDEGVNALHNWRLEYSKYSKKKCEEFI